MPTKVEVPAPFLKALRKLASRFPSVLREFEALSTQLKSDERPGKKVPGVDYDVYKVRLKNPSARKGKSGGFRLLYYLYLKDHVILLNIYSKSDQSDISPHAIRKIIEEVLSQHSDDNEE